MWHAQLERCAQRENMYGRKQCANRSEQQAAEPSAKVSNSAGNYPTTRQTELSQQTTTRDRERCKDIPDFDVDTGTTTRDRERCSTSPTSTYPQIDDSSFAAIFKTAAQKARRCHSNLRPWQEAREYTHQTRPHCDMTTLWLWKKNILHLIYTAKCQKRTHRS